MDAASYHQRLVFLPERGWKVIPAQVAKVREGAAMKIMLAVWGWRAVGPGTIPN